MEDPFQDDPNSDAPPSSASSEEKLDFLRSRLWPKKKTEDVEMKDGNNFECEDATMADAEEPAPRKTGILDLPNHLIEDIFVLAGLPTDVRINVNYGRKAPVKSEVDMEEWWFGNDKDDERAYEAKLVRSIITTCKRFYFVAVPHIYRENHIVIHWRNGHTLAGLAQLSNLALSNLRKVLIVLSASAPVIDNRGVVGGPDIELHKVDEPLSLKSPRYKELSAQWESIAARLQVWLSPDMVWFDFVCDCADLETAVEVVEPLSLMPTLRHAFIRLSRVQIPEMQKLARQVALRAVRRTHDLYGDPFPFLRLPQELRQLVLDHTDLVTPRREVEWNPTEKFHVRNLRETVCDLCQCFECPGGVHPWTMHWFMWGVEGRRARTFCNRFCSAFEATGGNFLSQLAQTCLCWRNPQYLFLVSKEFTIDARTTFYRRNRFMIKPAGDQMLPAESCMGRTEISRFLGEQIPVSALHALKRLDIVYPFFENHGYFTRNTEVANQDLCLTLAAVAPYLNIPNLTVTIHMADYTTYRDSDKDIWDYAATPIHLPPLIMFCQERTVNCWKVLAELGLKKFFVVLYRPWNWENAIEADDHQWYTLVTNDVFSEVASRSVMAAMEKEVMGPEYDSEKMGKNLLEKPMWMIRIEHLSPY
ncbi:hypothetical protein BDZ85DRAFT_258270 [Elsinoe ampelina]|uniref:Uncharacterized protein n=1 Tax=Elsinoe ampelina TaxID=302913 RepID=A0A6A6GJT7_9PEZI|nr:hypothetical protein BDZ85DRAFT_258270 [Elsinoe ampelina]